MAACRVCGKESEGEYVDDRRQGQWRQWNEDGKLAVQAYFVADAVSSFDPELHRATLRNIELKYGVVMTTDELLAAVAPAVSVTG